MREEEGLWDKGCLSLSGWGWGMEGWRVGGLDGWMVVGEVRNWFDGCKVDSVMLTRC
jgi:hypothetical protein